MGGGWKGKRSPSPQVTMSQYGKKEGGCSFNRKKSLPSLRSATVNTLPAQGTESYQICLNCPWHWIAQQINNLTVSCACLLFLKFRIFSGTADYDDASSCLSFLIVGYCTSVNPQHLYAHLDLNHKIVKCRTFQY